MKKVITFGEVLLRLSPDNLMRFIQADKYEAFFGGSEANVAVSLANYGLDVAHVGKYPHNTIGQTAINSLRRYGVDTSFSVMGGDRLGIYYLERGFAPCSNVCIYDRANSSMSTATVQDFDWDKIFANADWFHFSGITPALNPEIAQICLIACQKAQQKGLTISCDINYRSKLWSIEEAKTTMAKFCPYIDICIVNEDEALVLGVSTSGLNNFDNGLNHQAYEDMATKIAKKYGFKIITSVARIATSEHEMIVAGMIYENGKFNYSKVYPLHITDCIGAGDSFCGGLIYALKEHKDAQETIEFATSACALKHMVKGDYNQVTLDEVNKLVAKGSIHSVQR